MTQEKEKWMMKMANILRHIKMQNMYSNEFTSIKKDHEFFNDACNYVNLIYELTKLEETLRNVVNYSHISEE